MIGNIFLGPSCVGLWHLVDSCFNTIRSRHTTSNVSTNTHSLSAFFSKASTSARCMPVFRRAFSGQVERVWHIWHGSPEQWVQRSPNQSFAIKHAISALENPNMDTILRRKRNSPNPLYTMALFSRSSCSSYVPVSGKSMVEPVSGMLNLV